MRARSARSTWLVDQSSAFCDDSRLVFEQQAGLAPGRLNEEAPAPDGMAREHSGERGTEEGSGGCTRPACPASFSPSAASSSSPSASASSADWRRLMPARRREGEEMNEYAREALRMLGSPSVSPAWPLPASAETAWELLDAEAGGDSPVERLASPLSSNEGERTVLSCVTRVPQPVRWLGGEGDRVPTSGDPSLSRSSAPLASHVSAAAGESSPHAPGPVNSTAARATLARAPWAVAGGFPVAASPSTSAWTAASSAGTDCVALSPLQCMAATSHRRQPERSRDDLEPFSAFSASAVRLSSASSRILPPFWPLFSPSPQRTSSAVQASRTRARPDRGTAQESAESPGSPESPESPFPSPRPWGAPAWPLRHASASSPSSSLSPSLQSAPSPAGPSRPPSPPAQPSLQASPSERSTSSSLSAPFHAFSAPVSVGRLQTRPLSGSRRSVSFASPLEAEGGRPGLLVPWGRGRDVRGRSANSSPVSQEERPAFITPSVRGVFAAPSPPPTPLSPRASGASDLSLAPERPGEGRRRQVQIEDDSSDDSGGDLLDDAHYGLRLLIAVNYPRWINLSRLVRGTFGYPGTPSTTCSSRSGATSRGDLWGDRNDRAADPGDGGSPAQAGGSAPAREGGARPQRPRELQSGGGERAGPPRQGADADDGGEVRRLRMQELVSAALSFYCPPQRDGDVDVCAESDTVHRFVSHSPPSSGSMATGGTSSPCAGFSPLPSLGRDGEGGSRQGEGGRESRDASPENASSPMERRPSGPLRPAPAHPLAVCASGANAAAAVPGARAPGGARLRSDRSLECGVGSGAASSGGSSDDSRHRRLDRAIGRDSSQGRAAGGDEGQRSAMASGGRGETARRALSGPPPAFPPPAPTSASPRPSSARETAPEARARSAAIHAETGETGEGGSGEAEEADGMEERRLRGEAGGETPEGACGFAEAAADTGGFDRRQPGDGDAFSFSPFPPGFYEASVDQGKQNTCRETWGEEEEGAAVSRSAPSEPLLSLWSANSFAGGYVPPHQVYGDMRAQPFWAFAPAAPDGLPAVYVPHESLSRTPFYVLPLPAPSPLASGPPSSLPRVGPTPFESQLPASSPRSSRRFAAYAARPSYTYAYTVTSAPVPAYSPSPWNAAAATAPSHSSSLSPPYACPHYAARSAFYPTPYCASAYGAPLECTDQTSTASLPASSQSYPLPSYSAFASPVASPTSAGLRDASVYALPPAPGATRDFEGGPSSSSPLLSASSPLPSSAEARETLMSMASAPSEAAAAVRFNGAGFSANLSVSSSFSPFSSSSAASLLPPFWARGISVPSSPPASEGRDVSGASSITLFHVGRERFFSDEREDEFSAPGEAEVRDGGSCPPLAVDRTVSAPAAAQTPQRLCVREASAPSSLETAADQTDSAAGDGRGDGGGRRRTWTLSAPFFFSPMLHSRHLSAVFFAEGEADSEAAAAGKVTRAKLAGEADDAREAGLPQSPLTACGREVDRQEVEVAEAHEEGDDGQERALGFEADAAARQRFTACSVTRVEVHKPEHAARGSRPASPPGAERPWVVGASLATDDYACNLASFAAGPDGGPHRSAEEEAETKRGKGKREPRGHAAEEASSREMEGLQECFSTRVSPDASSRAVASCFAASYPSLGPAAAAMRFAGDSASPSVAASISAPMRLSRTQMEQSPANVGSAPFHSTSEGQWRGEGGWQEGPAPGCEAQEGAWAVPSGATLEPKAFRAGAGETEERCGGQGAGLECFARRERYGPALLETGGTRGTSPAEEQRGGENKEKAESGSQSPLGVEGDGERHGGVQDGRGSPTRRNGAPRDAELRSPHRRRTGEAEALERGGPARADAANREGSEEAKEEETRKAQRDAGEEGGQRQTEGRFPSDRGGSRGEQAPRVAPAQNDARPPQRPQGDERRGGGGPRGEREERRLVAIEVGGGGIVARSAQELDRRVSDLLRAAGVAGPTAGNAAFFRRRAQNGGGGRERVNGSSSSRPSAASSVSSTSSSSAPPVFAPVCADRDSQPRALQPPPAALSASRTGAALREEGRLSGGNAWSPRSSAFRALRLADRPGGPNLGSAGASRPDGCREGADRQRESHDEETRSEAELRSGGDTRGAGSERLPSSLSLGDGCLSARSPGSRASIASTSRLLFVGPNLNFQDDAESDGVVFPVQGRTPSGRDSHAVPHRPPHSPPPEAFHAVRYLSSSPSLSSAASISLGRSLSRRRALAVLGGRGAEEPQRLSGSLLRRGDVPVAAALRRRLAPLEGTSPERDGDRFFFGAGSSESEREAPEARDRAGASSASSHSSGDDDEGEPTLMISLAADAHPFPARRRLQRRRTASSSSRSSSPLSRRASSRGARTSAFARGPPSSAPFARLSGGRFLRGGTGAEGSSRRERDASRPFDELSSILASLVDGGGAGGGGGELERAARRRLDVERLREEILSSLASPLSSQMLPVYGAQRATARGGRLRPRLRGDVADSGDEEDEEDEEDEDDASSVVFGERFEGGNPVRQRLRRLSLRRRFLPSVPRPSSLFPLGSAGAGDRLAFASASVFPQAPHDASLRRRPALGRRSYAEVAAGLPPPPVSAVHTAASRFRRQWEEEVGEPEDEDLRGRSRWSGRRHTLILSDAVSPPLQAHDGDRGEGEDAGRPLARGEEGELRPTFSTSSQAACEIHACLRALFATLAPPPGSSQRLSRPRRSGSRREASDPSSDETARHDGRRARLASDPSREHRGLSGRLRFAGEEGSGARFSDSQTSALSSSSCPSSSSSSEEDEEVSREFAGEAQRRYAEAKEDERILEALKSYTQKLMFRWRRLLALKRDQATEKVLVEESEKAEDGELRRDCTSWDVREAKTRWQRQEDRYAREETKLTEKSLDLLQFWGCVASCAESRGSI
ncbi:hypothetical protein BESB_054770 [Besnoitia besnoiti]|uniref:Uncharacterized protein n=1 Tax=Besnoitia besnoiti TaxID=94643 RepID=A0A2A9MIN8_BESBE|nr:hypothetical protein BESB_054770 [Besnoitia besnoiti]PFH35826.1 hypothetical protein BESB_054770 [Besnoitia besnoiti]